MEIVDKEFLKKVNLAVCEHVMGNRIVDNGYHYIEPGHIYRNRIPHYASDIHTCWMMVEEMKRHGWALGLSMDLHFQWMASFRRLDSDASTSVFTNKNQDLAMCLAALDAYGKRV